MPPVITVNHLSKYYQDIKAVDDISFTVNKGDVYGFLGQNGAGKSTTIRMLLTLIQPTAGTIEIFGMDIRKHREEILRQVGAVIERPDLYKYLSALENLRLFAKLSGLKLSDTQLMLQLERVDLHQRAHSKVHTFSQGMKQRLGIAVALVHDPQLVILDEPTNGLDPQGIADIRQLIVELSREHGKTVLVSSHLLNEIELTATRMIIINKGKKMAEGALKEMFDPSKMLIELRVANPDHTLQQLQQSVWKSLLVQQEANLFTIRMNETDIPRLIADLVSMGVAINSLQPRHSLEAYFLSLTTSNQHVDHPAN
ncbi:ABC transporter ATP-binding protein [Pseudobacter ginsenosidimutans]|uniref:ABC-2 type transport system ATP-binding protein n=1 Tax=Pseudobacter ginsenosidimutans TaxID=661488 RepID=A0A4Q7MVS7_9BACT|nr:ABC transporter ATP-binding protein [Pseudobacter ginsenosidimutans]QEC41949.1 ABC transporter ATP-binding protein [Pseudobacter ginsenosidimutans]RZS71223.1 ABC-2 type transport system ATP-binding protein [Pseudobacter ginsenosidimutans]